MSDPGAGNYLDGAAAHPYLEGELQLLPAPDLHAVIVVTELSKPFLSKHRYHTLITIQMSKDSTAP